MWYRRCTTLTMKPALTARPNGLFHDFRVDGGALVDHARSLRAARVQLRLSLLGVDRLADLVRVGGKLGGLLVDVDVVELGQLLVDLCADLGKLCIPGGD